MLDALSKVVEHLQPVLIRDSRENAAEKHRAGVDDGDSEGKWSWTLFRFCDRAVETAWVMFQSTRSRCTVGLELKTRSLRLLVSSKDSVIRVSWKCVML